MENIDIIIIAGVSFLLVVGGLFIGMYLARRTEAERVAKLEEREERVLRMRAKLEHDRFSISSEDPDGVGLLDEDLFKGFKEELEQERMELDMRREEMELDMRMLEEENDRLKSRLTGREPSAPAIVSDPEEATIVNEASVGPPADIEDAVFAEDDDGDASDDGLENRDEPVRAEASDAEDAAGITSNAAEPDSAPESTDEVAERAEVDAAGTYAETNAEYAAERGDGTNMDSDAERSAETDAESDTEPVAETDADEKARNTIFGDFFFDRDATPDLLDLPEGEAGTTAQYDLEGEMPGIPDSSDPGDGTDELDSDLSGQDRDEPAPPDDGWSSEPDEQVSTRVDVRFPEPVGGDGASSLARSKPVSTPEKSPDQHTPGPPAFDHMLTADGDFPADGSIEQVLGLSRSDLALMNDLGYGTFRSIADLGEDEITRLAETFDIPEQTIREEWIPDSRMRAAREPRS